MNVSNNNSNDSFREFRPEKSKQCSKLFTHRANLQLLNFCISDKSSTSLKWHSVHHISHYIHFAFITYIITVRYILGDWNSVRKINRQTEHFKVNVKRKLCLSFISCCDVYASEIAYWTSKKKKKKCHEWLDFVHQELNGSLLFASYFMWETDCWKGKVKTCLATGHYFSALTCSHSQLII